MHKQFFVIPYKYLHTFKSKCSQGVFFMGLDQNHSGFPKEPFSEQFWK